MLIPMAAAGLKSNSAGGFVPTDIAGLIGWWDASDAASITDTGGLVDTWADKSATDADLTGVTTQRPTTGSRTLNTLNVLDFDGNDAVEQSVAMDLATGDQLTCLMVVEVDGGGSDQALWEFGPNTNTSKNGAGLLYITSGNLMTYFTLTGAPDRIQTVQSASLTLPDVLLVEVTLDRTAGGTSLGNLWVNGTQATSRPNNASQSAGITDYPLHAGSRNETSLFVNGGVGEMVFYNSVLSTADRETARDYLNSKWAVY